MYKNKALTVITAFIIFAFALSGCQAASDNPQDTQADGEADVVIQLSAEDYSFSEKIITVQKGQRVRIELAVTEGFHDWVVDEFDVATAQVSEGDNTAVEFMADQTGEFEYYCSVGSHRAMGMVGTLIVQD